MSLMPSWLYRMYTFSPKILILLLLLTGFFFRIMFLKSFEVFIFRFWLLLSVCFCSYTQNPPLSGTYALQLHLVSSESHLLHSSAWLSVQMACDLGGRSYLLSSVTSKKELYGFFYLFTKKGGFKFKKKILSNIFIHFLIIILDSKRTVIQRDWKEGELFRFSFWPQKTIQTESCAFIMLFLYTLCSCLFCEIMGMGNPKGDFSDAP